MINRKTQYFKNLVIVVLIIELLIFAGAYYSTNSTNELIRLMARYTARVSALVFIVSIFNFIKYKNNSIDKFNPLVQWLTLFAIVHYIHLCFLWANVIMNKIELVPIKLLGGLLAYLFILILPLIIRKRKLPIGVMYVYFYFVGLVFIITYIARLNGDFEGASPSLFHFIGIGAISVALFSILISNKIKFPRI